MRFSDRSRRITIWVCLLALVLLIRLFSFSSPAVEDYYSTGIYPYIGLFFRAILGWLPFSFGDILYFFAGCWLLYKLVRAIIVIRKRQFSKRSFISGLLHYVAIALLIYILFNIFWGLNYNRKGIAYQLHLDIKEYPVENLKEVTDILIEKSNNFKLHSMHNRPASNSNVFREAVSSYQTLQSKFPFLAYKVRSVKPSLYGVMGNYMGYMGYYNPFTGEAQVNTTVPKFTLPYVSCHEIAHQLGYARENEANFVGFLAARESKDTAFLYSVYFDLFLYANSELYLKDSTAARQNMQKLVPAVKLDIQELRRFRKKYQNPMDRLIDSFYDQYLRLNQQPEGKRTYNKVVLWLMAYYEKYKEL
jgi:hypothetical protein